MPNDQATGNRPIHLNYRSVEQVVIEPDDRDRFLMTQKEAARACQRAENGKQWAEDFDRFLVRVHGWCQTHTDRVEAAYVTVGDGALNIFVCTSGEHYQSDFDDDVTNLDISLTKQFPWLVAEVLQIPGSVRPGQLSLEKAIQVYGDGNPARSTSPA